MFMKMSMAISPNKWSTYMKCEVAITFPESTLSARSRPRLHFHAPGVADTPEREPLCMCPQYRDSSRRDGDCTTGRMLEGLRSFKLLSHEVYDCRSELLGDYSYMFSDVPNEDVVINTVDIIMRLRLTVPMRRAL